MYLTKEQAAKIRVCLRSQLIFLQEINDDLTNRETDSAESVAFFSNLKEIDDVIEALSFL